MWLRISLCAGMLWRLFFLSSLRRRRVPGPIGLDEQRILHTHTKPHSQPPLGARLCRSNLYVYWPYLYAWRDEMVWHLCQNQRTWCMRYIGWHGTRAVYELYLTTIFISILLPMSASNFVRQYIHRFTVLYYILHGICSRNVFTISWFGKQGIACYNFHFATVFIILVQCTIWFWWMHEVTHRHAPERGVRAGVVILLIISHNIKLVYSFITRYYNTFNLIVQKKVAALLNGWIKWLVWSPRRVGVGKCDIEKCVWKWSTWEELLKKQLFEMCWNQPAFSIISICKCEMEVCWHNLNNWWWKY